MSLNKKLFQFFIAQFQVYSTKKTKFATQTMNIFESSSRLQSCLPACFHGMRKIVFSWFSHASPGIVPLKKKTRFKPQKKTVFKSNSKPLAFKANWFRRKNERRLSGGHVSREQTLFVLMAARSTAAECRKTNKLRFTIHKSRVVIVSLVKSSLNLCVWPL